MTIFTSVVNACIDKKTQKIIGTHYTNTHKRIQRLSNKHIKGNLKIYRTKSGNIQFCLKMKNSIK